MAKKEKRVQTYSERHNKAVRLYQKSSLFLMWAGIVNALASILGVFGVGTSIDAEGNLVDYRYSMCLSVNRMINVALENSGLDQWVFSLIIVLLSLAFGALFSLFGYLASIGKRTYLLVGGGLYALDFVLFFYAFLATNWTTYAFGLATHAVIFIAIGIAIFEYFNVLSIERHYKMNVAKGNEHGDEQK